LPTSLSPAVSTSGAAEGASSGRYSAVAVVASFAAAAVALSCPPPPLSSSLELAPALFERVFVLFLSSFFFKRVSESIPARFRGCSLDVREARAWSASEGQVCAEGQEVLQRLRLKPSPTSATSVFFVLSSTSVHNQNK